MDEIAFSQLSELVRRRSGNVLSADKSDSIARRLEPVAHLFGFKGDIARLLAELDHPREELAQAIAEALTTQDTAFFRDPAVFAHFESNILPATIAARAGRRRLRVWSAGCATGQEAYSLAMNLDEVSLAASGWTIDLIATDISAAAVARTKDAIYSNYEVHRGLSEERRARYFAKEGDSWRVDARLRRSVVCRTFNILDHFGWLGEFDVIFCRNVLMYLAPEERAAVLEKFAQALAPDGTLALGHAESGAANAAAFRAADGPRGIFVKR